MERITSCLLTHPFAQLFVLGLQQSLAELYIARPLDKGEKKNIKLVYVKVYLIRLLVLQQLLITALWRNDNSRLGLHMRGTRASGVTGKPPVTTVVHQHTVGFVQQ